MKKQNRSNILWFGLLLAAVGSPMARAVVATPESNLGEKIDQLTATIEKLFAGKEVPIQADQAALLQLELEKLKAERERFEERERQREEDRREREHEEELEQARRRAERAEEEARRTPREVVKKVYVQEPVVYRAPVYRPWGWGGRRRWRGGFGRGFGRRGGFGGIRFRFGGRGGFGRGRGGGGRGRGGGGRGRR